MSNARDLAGQFGELLVDGDVSVDPDLSVDPLKLARRQEIDAALTAAGGGMTLLHDYSPVGGETSVDIFFDPTGYKKIAVFIDRIKVDVGINGDELVGRLSVDGATFLSAQNYANVLNATNGNTPFSDAGLVFGNIRFSGFGSANRVASEGTYSFFGELHTMDANPLIRGDFSYSPDSANSDSQTAIGSLRAGYSLQTVGKCQGLSLFWETTNFAAGGNIKLYGVK